MVLKLIYFAIPGRAEAARMILTYGGIAFEEETVDWTTWPPLKETTPLGQVPVLVLEDGRQLAQSGAIERYAAKLSGLYPSDPVVAAFADQAAFLVADATDLLTQTFGAPTPELRVAARQELMAGKMREKLGLLVKLLEEKGPYVAGEELSWADFTTFAFLGYLKGGDMEGVSKTVVDEYPPLTAFCDRLANLAPIRARYAGATGSRTAFLPA